VNELVRNCGKMEETGLCSTTDLLKTEMMAGDDEER
jgi:hypothetical protein